MLIRFPLYFKIVMLLLGIFLFFYCLDIAKHIFVIISLAALFSILLLPLNNWLEKLKIPRLPAIIICLILVTLILVLLGFFIYSQIIKFIEDFDLIIQRLTELMHRSADFFADFGVDKKRHEAWIKESVSGTLKKGSSVLMAAISFTTTTVSIVGLLPIFIFFMLYYRDFYKEFLLKIFHNESHPQVNIMVNKIENVVQNYLVGVLIVTTIISVMNIVGLSLLGVKYAFFFGVLAGILNIIPYVGVLIGSSLPILYTYITGGSLWQTLGVLIVMWAIQFIEGHFITPNVVGSRVSLNPFAAIIALIVGGQLWGPVGMILFIPFTAVLKVICDSVESLEPYGFLLGNPAKNQKSKKDKPLNPIV
ncbi:MAG TPA: AI-2E family transporter [Cytophagaceae bacterium]|jgi:predicted PurR-regulated permease PerM|nr:AI-2E family transporter [Cytophagaceae bacterium]